MKEGEGTADGDIGGYPLHRRPAYYGCYGAFAFSFGNSGISG